VRGDDVSDARGWSPGDRLNVVGEPVAAVGALKAGHVQLLLGDTVRKAPVEEVLVAPLLQRQFPRHDLAAAWPWCGNFEEVPATLLRKSLAIAGSLVNLYL
jgi:hypothetical protein